MLLKKNILAGKHKLHLFILFFFAYFFLINSSFSQSNLEGSFTNLKILDKISSKNTLLKLKNGEQVLFKDLSIKSLKCKNSEFDDNPEITAYIQVKDLTNENNDEVFVFNGWMFSSSPSIAPFDHPVYDVWLTSCY
ncbi:DUF2155 domain-containing protein [Candidatus Pelagibacter sp.]|nr:DUF2155 domain-containing protein [Candidatus Pelagibacter sp.]